MATRTTKSPLRYPGGKTQLADFVRQILNLNNIHGTYIEPFAGGAGIAIDLLLNNDIDRIVINDFDPSIHAIWYSILNHTDDLIQKIKSVPFDYTTPHSSSEKELITFWDEQHDTHMVLAKEATSLENAFSTLMLNRMNISGIITGGPIGGRKQTGKYQLDARFNKATLIKKITAIAEQRDRIDLYNLDANDLISVIQDKYESDSTFIFFDPPYYVQGKKLYLSFFETDEHARLAKNILSMDSYNWITTYDNAPQISDLYNSATYRYEYTLNYSANRRGNAFEYLFASENTILPVMEKMMMREL